MAQGARWALTDGSGHPWQAFAAATGQATLFHHPAWVELLQVCYGYRPLWLLCYDETGAIQAGLPLMEVRTWLTPRRWVSLPFTDYCTPLYRDADARAALADALRELTTQGGAPRLELRWGFEGMPWAACYSHYVLHRLDLTAGAAQLGRGLDSMHRQNIRAARKHDLRVERGEDLAALRRFYDLQLETRRRKGIPTQPWRYFRLIKEHLFDRGLGFVLLAFKGDDCLAGAVFLHWQRSIMCKYAASREDALDLRPNNLVFWTGIMWACEHGFGEFDMGRSELANSGLREFKTRWGAVEEPLLYSVSRGPAPRGPGESRWLRLAQPIIRSAPPRVGQAAGELLYRHFG